MEVESAAARSSALFLLADIFGRPITAHSPSRILAMMAAEDATAGETGTGSNEGASIRVTIILFFFI